jgi:CTD kinase subunit alpha
MSEKKDDEQTSAAPSRGPPSGPAGSTPSGPKFSFAFKATSKAPVAAPKPEISQKFSAAPPRKEPPPPPPTDDRSNRERDLPRDTPTGPASSRAREAPTGPASSRGRADSDYRSRPRAPEPPNPPRQTRTRRIKKIERNLKQKPTLSEQLGTSISPFYRKQGNESVVGSGTYGKVYKGKQIYSSRLVALKKIRMEGERDGFPVTAMREIKLLQSLRHDNIVALEEVMVERNDCFMVFEYLSHDLTGLLNHPSFKLDAAQKKHLAKQLFEGLDYLHTRGVLHRDIKAANILVSSDGVLKLADFGLARFYAKHHHVDYTNRVITIWYRSPELLLGETQYNAAVDVWSAACVMVEIFTRHAIFPGDGTEINQLDKIYAVLGTPNKVDWPDLVKMEWFELLRPGYRKPNVFAEKYKERVPPAAFELLAAMFQYDPAKRPTAAEVLNHAYFTTEQPPPRQAIE